MSHTALRMGALGQPSDDVKDGIGIDPLSARLIELRALRIELLSRIAFQNLTLLLLWVAFGSLLAGALLVDDAELLIVYDLLALVASAFWAHHACRTMQIRRHLLGTVEPEFFGSSTVGWEDWLSRHPIEGLLGSRWFIATKGFILGSQVVAAAAAYHVAGRAEIPFAVVASVLFVASIWVLWKPALVSDRTTAASESAAQPSPSAQAGAAR